ncbi:hypothetical protein NQ317_018627 [Molorchus minor]|uniref:Large ribosomal subunit protein mL37 n=1 Tax=Molorchus minor TaxID=1323400 RepID=A0ABQ9J3C9_9CUCU|nr:hypothetical protein NQ317_018627 [Molorchus minor]
MRRSVVLFRQHIGWHFIKHWRVQGKRKPLNTGAEKILTEKGIPVCKAEDILNEKRACERYNVTGYKDKPILLDESHPNWHQQPLLSYGDNNVLLEGLPQAKILTKTIEVRNGLPTKVSLKNLSKDVNNRVQNIILETHTFDAEQKKLPKIKDPNRPAWNFPRVLGITQKRRSFKRYILNDLVFSYPFMKFGDLIQFQLSGETVITSSKPLAPITLEPTESLELPDIAPIKPTITLNRENIYEVENIYPVKSQIKKSHPHTIFVHYDKEQVKNLYEEEVTETQIFGRSLLKAFTAAASYARQKYGNDVKVLPKPVTLQSVQTDGQFYHFGIFQLNTLDLEEGSTKNIWYQTPLLYLFESCGYNLGKPVLDGYNDIVVKNLYAFYNNV